MEPFASSDRELLERVIKRKDFLQSILCSDSLDDWGLARDLGEFIVRIEPESDIMGHALLTRALRHLGDLVRARDELKQCQERTASRELKPWEIELFLPFLAYEEKLLSPSTGIG